MLSPNVAHSSASLDEYVRCPKCSNPRFFKGQRGLKIHDSRCHVRRDESENQSQTTTHSVPSPSIGNTVSVECFWKKLSALKQSTPILKRIPRGARHIVAQTLSTDINKVLVENNSSTWENLLTFPFRIFHVVRDIKYSSSLTEQVKRNCGNKGAPLPQISPHNSIKNSIKLVENKISDGDIRGAAKILFSNDALAPESHATLTELHKKHPPAPSNFSLPSPPSDNEHTLTVSCESVKTAILSFPSGSAGSLDGLTPQHLKDLTSSSLGEVSKALLKSITDLVNLMLSGKVSNQIIDVLYGANLCALKKKDGGIRPIAVGFTYRRLAAKICCNTVLTNLSGYFQPLQLGFGSKGGCEAAVHALRTFLHHRESEVLVKIDIENAFNTVDRGALLTQIKDKIPTVYGFLWQCYSRATKLVYKNNLLSSEVGCQQGDPLGPAIFSLAIHPIIERLNSKFNVWYLDDGIVGGDVETVLSDLKILSEELTTIGLSINNKKCELYISDSCANPNLIIDKFTQITPNIKYINNSNLRLLGCPISSEAFNTFIEEKIQNFNEISNKFFQLNTHMAYFIMRSCLFVPKFTYALRCCHLWKFPNYTSIIDNIIQKTLSSIINIQFCESSWSQATLPIRFGGLGIRKISDVSLPAYLSSVHTTLPLVTKILNRSQTSFEVPYLTEAKNAWIHNCPNTDLPIHLSSQKLWDEPLCKLVRNKLLQTSSSLTERARLMASNEWESGLWLQVLPSVNLGTLLDRTTFRLAACIRLGANINVPHHCRCGKSVDNLGHHGLSCHRSAGRLPRHSAINDIIRRALASTGAPAILEPAGLARDDGKRPDGMTLVPWQQGRPLVWDVTCVDTLAKSHLPNTANKASTAAAAAESNKTRKYTTLGSGYIFSAFGVETLGPWGPGAHDIYKQISRRLIEASHDQKAGLYLAQRISIAIQRGNAACLLGTLPLGSDLEQIFYL